MHRLGLLKLWEAVCLKFRSRVLLFTLLRRSESGNGICHMNPGRPRLTLPHPGRPWQEEL